MSGHKEHCSFHYHCIRTSTDVTQKVAKVPFTVSVSPINLQHEEDVDAIMHSLHNPVQKLNKCIILEFGDIKVSN